MSTNLADYTQTHMQARRALDYVRLFGCIQRHGQTPAAFADYLARYKGTDSDETVRKALNLETKSVITAGTTTNTSWAGALVGQMAIAFVAIARSESLIGRIPNLRRVPWNVRVPLQSQAASYAWIPEGGMKPVSKLAFDPGITLGPMKASGIIITTKELALLAAPGSEAVLRDELTAGLNTFLDTQFIDPAIAAVAGTRPASITNGTVAIAGTGVLATDMAALIKAFWAGRPAARAPVLVASGANAAAIRSLNGGGGLGYDVVISEVAGANVIMLDPRAVLVADAGIELDVSDQASIEMDSAPTGGASAVVVSLFQENKAGYRVESRINWQPLAGAARYLTTI